MSAMFTPIGAAVADVESVSTTGARDQGIVAAVDLLLRLKIVCAAHHQHTNYAPDYSFNDSSAAVVVSAMLC